MAIEPTFSCFYGMLLVIFQENRDIVERNGFCAADLHKIPLDEKGGGLLYRIGGEGARIRVSSLRSRENRGSSREKQVVTGWWGRETDARRMDGEGQSTKRTAGMTERNERANEREGSSWTVLPPTRCGAARREDGCCGEADREGEGERNGGGGEDRKR